MCNFFTTLFYNFFFQFFGPPNHDFGPSLYIYKNKYNLDRWESNVFHLTTVLCPNIRTIFVIWDIKTEQKLVSIVISLNVNSVIVRLFAWMTFSTTNMHTWLFFGMHLEDLPHPGFFLEKYPMGYLTWYFQKQNIKRPNRLLEKLLTK